MSVVVREDLMRRMARKKGALVIGILQVKTLGSETARFLFLSCPLGARIGSTRIRTYRTVLSGQAPENRTGYAALFDQFTLEQ